MNIEKRRGYNCTWKEYIDIRMAEIDLDKKKFDISDERVRDIVADLYFEKEDDLDRTHKIPKE